MPENSNLLEQIATALFANSPFTEGKPNGYVSMRRFLDVPDVLKLCLFFRFGVI